MNPGNLAAIAGGLAAGFFAGVLFQWVASRMPRVDFWQTAATFARSLIVIREDDDFFARYGDLLKLLVRYLGRQALVIALPVVVVTAFALLILPAAEARAWPGTGRFQRRAARAPVVTCAGLSSWNAWHQTVEVTSLVCVCVGSGIGMTLSRKRP